MCLPAGPLSGLLLSIPVGRAAWLARQAKHMSHLQSSTCKGLSLTGAVEKGEFKAAGWQLGKAFTKSQKTACRGKAGTSPRSAAGL